MKTAISIPDDVFESADALAERLGVSRSHLYAVAVAEFVARHQQAKVTERLDAVYGPDPAGVDPALKRGQRRTITDTEW